MKVELSEFLGKKVRKPCWYCLHCLFSSPITARKTSAGKQFDEEGGDPQLGVSGMDLYYFGARYYDADVGLWTATDPTMQFWSGYSYMGNGVNPIIGVDRDGLKVTITINRNNNGSSVTKGTFSVSSDLVSTTTSGYTLEPPSNHATKNKISAGTYTGFTRTTASNGTDYSYRRVQLNTPVTGEDGNAMYGAQIHNGNYLSNTQGCVLFGNDEGVTDATISTSVGASGTAMDNLNALIDEDGSGEIEIIINDPTTDNN